MTEKHEYQGIEFNIEILEETLIATTKNGVVGKYSKNVLGNWYCSNTDSVNRLDISTLTTILDFITTIWSKQKTNDVKNIKNIKLNNFESYKTEPNKKYYK